MMDDAILKSLKLKGKKIPKEFDYRNYKQLIFENTDLKNFYIAYLEQNWVIENEKRQIAFATQTASERYLTFLEKYPN